MIRVESAASIFWYPVMATLRVLTLQGVSFKQEAATREKLLSLGGLQRLSVCFSEQQANGG